MSSFYEDLAYDHYRRHPAAAAIPLADADAFDAATAIDIDHNLTIGKTRCDELDGKVFKKPGQQVAEILNRWLGSGAVATVTASVPEPVNDVANELVAKFEAAATAEDVEAAKSAATAARDRLGKDAGRVRAALAAAQARVAA